MKRGLKISLATVSVLGAMMVVILLSAFIWIVTTQGGTQLVWRHARNFLPPGIEVHTLQGCLAGPLEIRGVKITHTAFELEIDRLTLEWQPRQLWNRMLDIESIDVKGMRYTQLEQGAEKSAEQPSAPTLPDKIELPFGVKINIAEASLHDFQFNTASARTPFEVFSARFKGGMDSEKIEISHLTLDSSLFRVEGHALLIPRGDFPLQGELNWQIPAPDYPTLSASTLISGTLREMEIIQSIAEPYAIQGTLHLYNPIEDPSFEISFLLNPLKLKTLNRELPALTTRMVIKGEGTPDDIIFNLEGWVETPDVGRVNTIINGGYKPGRITLNAANVGVAQQPAQATARGEVALGNTPELDLTLEWEQFQWPLRGEPSITSPQGELQLNGTWENLHAKLDIAVGDRGRIEGSAKREDDDVDLALLWHDLQWPRQYPTVISPRGNLALKGEIAAYSFNVHADIEAPQHADARVMFKGQGGREALHLSLIHINSLGGSLEGEGNLSWAPQLKGKLRLSAQDLNPEGILGEWPGNLGFSLQAQAHMDTGGPILQLEHFSAQGRLRGYEVALNATGSYADSTATLQRFSLSSGTSGIEINGTLGHTLDVHWQIQSNDLDSLLPGATGRLRGTGNLTGHLQKPVVTATLNAEELAYKNYRLKSLSLDADIDMAGKLQSQVLLKADNAAAAGVDFRTVVFSAHGTPEAHTLALKADTSRGGADIALTGDLGTGMYEERMWNFRLDRAEISYPGLDAWILQKPSSGWVSTDAAFLSEHCWESGEALLCLEGKYAADNAEANFTLSSLPFSYLSPYLPPELDIQGSLNGEGVFAQSGKNSPFANITLATSAISVLSRTADPQEGRNDVIIEVHPANFHARMEHGGLESQIEIPLSPRDRISLNGNIALGKVGLMKRALNGEIRVNIENLDFLAKLSPEVQNLSGRLAGDMYLAGSLEAPEIHGELALLEGMAELDRPGLNLKDIQVKLRGEGTNQVYLDAHAASGEGVLNIVGNSDLRGNADIHVIGEKFRAVNTLEAQIDASPDITLTLRQNRLDVEGELVIPKARITLKDIPESAVKVSDDQVLVKPEGSTKEATENKKEIYARVRTVLGDNVHFDGFGLKARIQGDLLVIDKPGEPTTASGELNIKDGEYRAYGQGLVVEKGRILFAGGPIDQPGLDVRAVRRPREGITVGVQVRGSLRKPDFKLFSDPTMTQGNQLSYLVLGRPLSGTSGSEGSALSRASLALGLKGGNAVAEKIGSSLGLDQFGLDQGEAGSDSSPENATFVIGKYLSPKLYVSYGLGLFNQISTLQLHYTISKHWKFMTESANEASGADVIYVIETGK